MTYLRIRLNKNAVQLQVKWNNGVWKLWNPRESAFQLGAYPTKDEALAVARLGSARLGSARLI